MKTALEILCFGGAASGSIALLWLRTRQKRNNRVFPPSDNGGANNASAGLYNDSPGLQDPGSGGHGGHSCGGHSGCGGH